MTSRPVVTPALPKAVLHDHLDGGLRVETILDLADAVGHVLPSADPDALRRYFRAGADAGDILAYLDTFQHTVAAMQTAEALARVAAESVIDLAADGVVYAEVRYAPELHQARGLALDAVVEAVDAGIVAGMAAAAAAGTPIEVSTILCGMRMFDRTVEVAELAVRSRDAGHRVVGFDLAGAETGFPPRDHRRALEVAKRGLLGITIHASEPPGLDLIADALACGADRIGHGVRLVEDTSVVDGRLRLGPLARYVLDHQIPLELAPSCNVQIAAVASIEAHPVGAFLREGFRVTVNTDNRLMSGVTVGSELQRCVDTFGWSLDDLETVVTTTVMSGFAPLADRRRLVDTRVVPAFAAARAH